MSTLCNFFSFSIGSFIIVAQLSYLWATIEATNSMFKAFNDDDPLTSTDEENTAMYPLTTPELVNVTQTSTKNEGGK
jgi:small neutral amino acid transporter SnatA (MarC family)